MITLNEVINTYRKMCEDISPDVAPGKAMPNRKGKLKKIDPNKRISKDEPPKRPSGGTKFAFKVDDEVIIWAGDILFDSVYVNYNGETGLIKARRIGRNNAGPVYDILTGKAGARNVLIENIKEEFLEKILDESVSPKGFTIIDTYRQMKSV